MSSRASVRPKRGEAAQDVGEPAVGDDRVAGLAQRSIAEPQRLGQGLGLEVDVRARRWR